MSIANQLERIRNAKNLMGKKAHEAGLEYFDFETDRPTKFTLDDEGNPNETIDKIAEGIDNINVVSVAEAVTVSEPNVSEEGLITVIGSASRFVLISDTPEENSVTVTKQLDVQAAKTVTPSKSEQVAVEKGRYTTGQVKVAAIPDNYVDTNIVGVNSMDDLTIDGPNVSIPAGYFPSDVECSVKVVGDVDKEIDPLTQENVSVQVNGWVNYVDITISADLENALAAI